MVWIIIAEGVAPYLYYLSFPASVVVGAIGYYAIEKHRKETPFKEKTIQEERDERKLRELDQGDVTEVAKLRTKTDIPRTVLDRQDKKV